MNWLYITNNIICTFPCLPTDIGLCVVWYLSVYYGNYFVSLPEKHFEVILKLKAVVEQL